MNEHKAKQTFTNRSKENNNNDNVMIITKKSRNEARKGYTRFVQHKVTRMDMDGIRYIYPK